MLKAPSGIFYHIDGLAHTQPRNSIYWVTEGFDKFSLKENDYLTDIETATFRLREKVGEKIFGSRARYHEALLWDSSLTWQAGIDSDIKISKESFEIFLYAAKEVHRRLLYYHDVSTLIGSLQNNVIETYQLMGEFFKELNEREFLMVEPREHDIVIVSSGLIVTKIFTFINHLFINLYSQYDYLAKIAWEVTHLQSNFDTYKKMASAKILMGDARRLALHNLPGTVFEESADIRMISYLRNEIVHNATIESYPKVFVNIKGGEIIEKFILLPDFENGVIKSIKARKRFFDQETKLNLIRPGLIERSHKRVVTTINAITSGIP